MQSTDTDFVSPTQHDRVLRHVHDALRGQLYPQERVTAVASEPSPWALLGFFAPVLSLGALLFRQRLGGPKTPILVVTDERVLLTKMETPFPAKLSATVMPAPIVEQRMRTSDESFDFATSARAYGEPGRGKVRRRIHVDGTDFFPTKGWIYA